MRSAQFVTQHQKIRLAAVDEAKRHTRVSGMKQRTLAFNDVPMIQC